MIAARTCHAPSNRERVDDYLDRVKHRADFDHLIHASRVAKGVRVQGELVRLPIPRHRALTIWEPKS
jgi:hypothetical protein